VNEIKKELEILKNLAVATVEHLETTQSLIETGAYSARPVNSSVSVATPVKDKKTSIPAGSPTVGKVIEHEVTSLDTLEGNILFFGLLVQRRDMTMD
jgi:hypothetical protein